MNSECSSHTNVIFNFQNNVQDLQTHEPREAKAQSYLRPTSNRDRLVIVLHCQERCQSWKPFHPKIYAKMRGAARALLDIWEGLMSLDCSPNLFCWAGKMKAVVLKQHYECQHWTIPQDLQAEVLQDQVTQLRRVGMYYWNQNFHLYWYPNIWLIPIQIFFKFISSFTG